VIRIALVVSAAAALAGCGGETPPPDTEPQPPPRSIEAIADAYFDAYTHRYPTFPTSAGLPGYRHDRLTDRSPAAYDAWTELQADLLAELKRHDWPGDVGSRDWVTYGILHEELSSSVASRVCRSELWAASTTTAWYTSLPFIFDYQPLDTDENRADALARLAALDEFIDQDIANLRRGLELGYSAPRVTVEKVPAEAASLLEEQNPFAAIADRVDDEAFDASVESLYADEIRPALERYITFIRDEYLPAARESLPVTDHPDGDKCYAALVRAFTTISPPTDEIHTLGVVQMERIQREFRDVIDTHFDGVPTAALLRRINSDPEFTFPTEQAVLEYSQAALDDARKAMPRAFGRLPEADVVIKPFPDFAASGVGAYQSAAEDGSRPGIFWIAVVDPETRTRATQKSTLYHETYPGHHLQIAIAQELGDDVHDVARYFGNAGFSEGWALYAERVAEELGLYTTPVDRLGLLSDQGARAARLVIDTGLHTKQWSRQQAVDYMLANTGWAETDIQNDVNRYISWPGQANAYMLGMLEIRRLRTLAEDALGDAFDLAAFHDRVLENGNVTLPMLEQSIETWVDEERAALAGDAADTQP
jgi:uncharacterized protein (DUF885 family)